jgi:Ca-activated chloride channel family protein
MLPAIPRLFLGSALTLSAVVAATGQAQQPPTFSAGNRTVAVYATVTNAAGRLVPDLDRGRFDVADNGKRQELTLFANDIQPITIVLLLDRSGSMREQFRLVQDAAGAFVDAMLPTDKARVGTFSTRVQIDPEDFTSDRGTLVDILRGDLQEPGPTPLWNAVDRGISALRRQEGRRVILVFTDGVDAPMNFKNGNSSRRSVLKRAEEEDVMVYAIGLATGDGSRGGFGPRGPGAPGPSGGFGGRSRGPGSFVNQPDEGLPRIAAATGGGYFELTSTSDLAATFARVANELHHQYALGFTPVTLDGRLHQLEVRVSGEGMKARARKSYLARR